MLSQLAERARWLATTVRLLNNWPDVYWRKFVKRQVSGRQVLRLRNGLVFEVAHKDHAFPILAEVLHHEVYRAGLPAAPLSREPIVIDIGGNIGASTIYFLREIPGARVLVFEPEPTNFALLESNLSANGFAGRTRALQQAVGGAEGPRTLYFAENSPTNSMFKQVGAPIEVQCTTLAQVFKDHEIDHCDLMKIDCEGAEYEILMTAPAAVLAKTRRIVLEWHEVPNHSPEELEQFLQRNGFSTFRPQHRFVVADNRSLPPSP